MQSWLCPRPFDRTHGRWWIVALGNNTVAHAPVGQPTSHFFAVEVVGKSHLDAAGFIERPELIGLQVEIETGEIIRSCETFRAPNIVAQQPIFHNHFLSELDLAFPGGQVGEPSAAAGLVSRPAAFRITLALDFFFPLLATFRFTTLL